MKPFSILLPLLLAVNLTAAENSTRRANTVVLDAAGVQNLRIQTAAAEPRELETTIFALGRIEVYPGHRAVISSRIAGRATEVLIKHDHFIKKGDTAVVVESRQVGNPPPSIPLTAPISGLVSVTHIVPGQPVGPDDVLAEILDLNEVYALAQVPEHLAGRLKSGQLARIKVTAASGEVFEAKLEHLGALADAKSGVVEAAFHVENPNFVLRPGMRAEFSIVVEKRPDVLSVPRAALQGEPANRFVYVKDFDVPNAFIKSTVVVGQSNDRFVEILSGVLPADEVVTQGAYSLAFAGAGTLSLKEALDSAHGHAHNADGSELTSDAKKGGPTANASAEDHGHSHGSEGGVNFWMLVSGVLFTLLLIVGFRKKNGVPDSAPVSARHGNGGTDDVK
jgi:multidrug efflux pump subunit AcrA (membrane-fusion protein)